MNDNIDSQSQAVCWRDDAKENDRRFPNTGRPFRFIFWGAIILAVDFKVNDFDIVNDFVGMLLILSGVARLSRAAISERYTKWMKFVFVITILSTINSFYSDVVCPLAPWLKFAFEPNTMNLAAVILYVTLGLFPIYVFYRCMLEYSVVKQCNFLVESWRYSIKLLKYWVVIPAIPFTMLFLHFASTLDFNPKTQASNIFGEKKQTICVYLDDMLIDKHTATWDEKLTMTFSGNELTNKVVITKNGEAIHTYNYPVGENMNFRSSDYDYDFDLHDLRKGSKIKTTKNTTITIGNWEAPLDGRRPWYLAPFVIWLVLGGLRAYIHFLMSMSRMTRVADNT